jgi:hypothetical protein
MAGRIGPLRTAVGLPGCAEAPPRVQSPGDAGRGGSTSPGPGDRGGAREERRHWDLLVDYLVITP